MVVRRHSADDAYDIIVASASRPHLLLRTLTSLARVDVPPRKIILHDDAVFPHQYDEIVRVVEYATKPVTGTVPYVMTQHDPPVRHGPALAWLLAQTDAEFVLYTQDDHEVVRDLPIARALDVMRTHDLNQIRFNKRATLDYKDTWQGRWYKKEFSMSMSVALPAAVALPSVVDAHDTIAASYPPPRIVTLHQTLTVSDHWYFQTSLWRVSVIKPIVLTLMARAPGAFAYRCEDLINAELDLRYATSLGHDARDPDVRAKYLRTFIWGRIGEDRYVQHIGDHPEDFARPRDVWEVL